MSMYTPTNAVTLEVATKQQIRLGIQGWAGVGKTWSALTFRNPIVMNLNRGLGAHAGRKDVIELPFYSDEWLKKLNPNFGMKTQNGEIMTKQVIEDWFMKEGPKLEADQTFVVDGQTDIQTVYHKWWLKNPALTNQGKIDDFGEYKFKILFFSNIMDFLRSMRCDVVWICHEIEQKGKDGTLTGKIRPLLSGQFESQLAGNFTDWFRQHAKSKILNDAKITPELLAEWGMKSVDEYKAMQNKFTGNTVYCWQTESDDTFDGKRSSLVNCPKYIPANWESFRQYLRPSAQMAHSIDMADQASANAAKALSQT
jgi:hypothetical protein